MRKLAVILLFISVYSSYAGEIHDAAAKGDLAKVKEIVAKDPKAVHTVYGRERWTPLFFAAGGGHEDIVKFLIENGAKVNFKDASGRNPLFPAARNGHIGVIEILIEYGADINHFDSYIMTPLKTAVKERRKEVVDWFLKHKAKVFHYRSTAIHCAARMKNNTEILSIFLKNGIDVDFLNIIKETPLFIAAYHGNLENLRLLLRNGAVRDPGDIPSSLKGAADKRQKAILKILLLTPKTENEPVDTSGIFYVVCNKTTDEVKKIIEADPGLLEKTTYEGWTPLHIAVLFGRNDLVSYFISKGADINKTGKRGWAPLHWACLYADIELIKLLLEHKADVNLKDNRGETPAFKTTYRYIKAPLWPRIKASEEDCLKIFEMLLKQGADLNIASKAGKTILYDAAIRRSLKIIEYLATRGVRLNQDWHPDYIPLIVVAVRDSDKNFKRYKVEIFKTCKLFIDNGADVNAADGEKRAVLHHLVRLGHPTSALMEYIIKQGADIHQRDKWGNTPLHLAAFTMSYVKPKDTVRIMKILLKAGADINARNRNGHTTLHFAARRGRKEACEFLISKGADLNIVNRNGHTPYAYALKYKQKHLKEVLTPKEVKKEKAVEGKKKEPEDIF